MRVTAATMATMAASASGRIRAEASLGRSGGCARTNRAHRGRTFSRSPPVAPGQLRMDRPRAVGNGQDVNGQHATPPHARPGLDGKERAPAVAVSTGGAQRACAPPFAACLSGRLGANRPGISSHGRPPFRTFADDRLCRRAPHDGRRPGPHQRRHRSAPDRGHAGAFRASASCPTAMAGCAYLDLDVPVAPAERGTEARRLLKPMVLAKLIQAADVAEGDRVLDVGCATGYSSALLARLAGSVVALEEDPALARRAARKSRRRSGRQRDGRDRAVDRRLAGRGPLRRHRPQRCDRNRAGGAVSAAQGRRPAGRHPRPRARRARRCSTARSAAMSAAGRSSMPPRRCCRALRSRRPSCSRRGSCPQACSPDRVWPEYTKRAVIVGWILSTGLPQGCAAPLWLSFVVNARVGRGRSRPRVAAVVAWWRGVRGMSRGRWASGCGRRRRKAGAACRSAPRPAAP